MLSKPLHILQQIVTHKQQEVAQMREQFLLEALSNPNAYPPRDFLQALQQSHHKPSLIAEVKKASPSKGIIRENFDPVSIAQAYERGGATCLSVLCDRKFFRGSFDYLRSIRQRISLPLLCKEFIIDPYQIYRARSCGADAVLLIAAILSPKEIQSLLQLTHSLGMEALVEVHTLAELDRVLTLSGLRLLGINNRNLENFSTDLQTTGQLMAQRRELLHKLGITIVSESGLHTQADLEFVTRAGVDAVLIGESLVRQTDPQAAISHLFPTSSYTDKVQSY